MSRFMNLAGVLLLSIVGITPVAFAEPPPLAPDYAWLDIEGRPLPFQDHESILDFLRTATVEERNDTERGVAGTEKVVLAKEGVRLHAAFRHIDEFKPQISVMRGKSYRITHDSAHFEVPAYELSQILGLGRVPPVVSRRIRGHSGTLQIWLEGTMLEVEREQHGVPPPNSKDWTRQMQLMEVFDAVVGNVDRNRGNIVIDQTWNVWYIDHTRAFVTSKKPIEPEPVLWCERSLFNALRTLDEELVRDRLGPHLSKARLRAVLTRARKLVKKLENLIEDRGEGAVLYDLE